MAIRGIKQRSQLKVITVTQVRSDDGSDQAGICSTWSGQVLYSLESSVQVLGECVSEMFIIFVA